METRNYLEIFYEFLKKMQAKQEYIRAYESEESEPLEEYLKIAPVDSYVSATFVWSDTKEGSDYWTDIEEAWMTKIKELGIEDE